MVGGAGSDGVGPHSVLRILDFPRVQSDLRVLRALHQPDGCAAVVHGAERVSRSVPADIAWFGEFPNWWPDFSPSSPAFFLPAFAILFRFTCYYYRGAYYKAFALRPPPAQWALARGVDYRGETSLLIFQNLHRYTLYAALVLLVFLWEEGIAALFRNGQFGIGVGTIVMLMNAALLTGYTFGCHSWRHLIAGRRDCFSCDGKGVMTYQAWRGSTWLNERHQLFAWLSLVWVAFTDAYIYLVSSGRIQDVNTWR